MPIYEYACPSCGHEFEKIVKIKAPNPPCPSCEGTDVAKKLSLSAFHLKGGGWYSDAYAGKDNKPAGSSSSSDASASSSSSDAGSSSSSSSDSSSSTSSASSSSDDG